MLPEPAKPLASRVTGPVIEIVPPVSAWIMEVPPVALPPTAPAVAPAKPTPRDWSDAPPAVMFKEPLLIAKMSVCPPVTPLPKRFEVSVTIPLPVVTYPAPSAV